MKIVIEKGRYDIFKKIDLSLEDNLNVILSKDDNEKEIISKLLAGFLTLDKGSIYFDDEDVTDLSPIKRKTSYIYANYQLYPSLSVKENITFPLKQIALDEKKIEDEFSSISKALAIETLLDKKTDELNDEEKMKVALAKALIKRPKFLLIDEAFDKLDKKDDLLKLIDEFGVATIYVTKDEMIAKSLSNKYYEIEDAKIEEKEFI